jgi:hypothetical protein
MELLDQKKRDLGAGFFPLWGRLYLELPWLVGWAEGELLALIWLVLVIDPQESGAFRKEHRIVHHRGRRK